jgi:hypothetical protein
MRQDENLPRVSAALFPGVMCTRRVSIAGRQQSLANVNVPRIWLVTISPW